MGDTRVDSLGELLNYALDLASSRLRVALPGRVESYDSTAQTVNVQPLLQNTTENEDGSTAVETLPIVNNVPVIFPGAGGHQIKLPVAKGDTVLLIFNDRSIDKWKSQGGLVDPVDRRTHNLSDAVAIVGLHSSNTTPAATIEIMSDGVVKVGGSSAVEFAAMANLVDARFAELKTVYNSHTHLTAGTGTPSVPTATLDDFDSVASTKVKVI